MKIFITYWLIFGFVCFVRYLFLVKIKKQNLSDKLYTIFSMLIISEITGGIVMPLVIKSWFFIGIKKLFKK